MFQNTHTINSEDIVASVTFICAIGTDPVISLFYCLPLSRRTEWFIGYPTGVNALNNCPSLCIDEFYFMIIMRLLLLDPSVDSLLAYKQYDYVEILWQTNDTLCLILCLGFCTCSAIAGMLLW